MATFAGRYAEALLFNDGTLAKGVLVTVNIAGTSTLATLYADHSRATLVANPTVTDPTTGMLDFWADPGLYDLYTPTGVVYNVPSVPDPGDYASLDITGRVPAGQLPVGSAAGTVAAGDDPRIVGAAGYSISGDVSPLRVETVHRLWTGNQLTLPNTSALFALFTPEVTLTATQLATVLVGTAAAGTTVARMGLYIVDATATNLICVARTASDTALWTGSPAVASRAVADSGATSPTPISQVVALRGQRYAFAAFIAATTRPVLACALTGSPLISALSPALAYAGPSGDTDLRPTYAVSSLTPTAAVLYGSVTP